MVISPAKTQSLNSLSDLALSFASMQKRRGKRKQGRGNFRNHQMIRTIIEDRFRRIWVILIGMTGLAVSVEVVTIIIHDRIG